MKKNYRWFMVVIVFVAGLMISNMLAQAEERDTPKIQWEYKTVRISYIDTISNETRRVIGTKRIRANRHGSSTRRISEKDLPKLNVLGKNGWELTGVNNINYYFKREIKD
jgi:hypothetical protein